MNTTTARETSKPAANNVRFQPGPRDAKSVTPPKSDVECVESTPAAPKKTDVPAMPAVNEMKDTDAEKDMDVCNEAEGPGFAPLLANRAQLHQRVDARIGALETELARLGPDAENSERGCAIELALRGAWDATSGGWDKVGEMEAAQLSQWLDTTETLILNPGASAVPCDAGADEAVTGPFAAGDDKPKADTGTVVETETKN